jgi:hypothetical protein
MFQSLNVEIWDLFEIQCLRLGIFNTLVSFLIKLATFHASSLADTRHLKPLSSFFLCLHILVAELFTRLKIVGLKEI